MTTMTSKGQVTVPKMIRDYLGLRPGSEVAFEINADGNATVRAAKPVHKSPRRSQAARLRGTLQVGKGADELMELLREYRADADDPGISSRR